MSASLGRGDRPPLLPWSDRAWARWAAAPRMSSAPIPRTKFLLIKAPASSLYEEKFPEGDRNVFTVSMYAARMMAKRIQVGCVIDCTALDLEAFEQLTDNTSKGNIRYFHDTNEWDDFDIDYKRLIHGSSTAGDGVSTLPLQATVDKFLSLCSSHWSSRPGTHIALFDSRGGYGTAAYLCARYMCEKMKAPVHVALASLKEVAKPCGLADADLIRDLQNRYKGRREWKLENVPSWWWPVEDDDDEDDDDKKKDGGEKSSGAQKRAKPSGEEVVAIIPPFGESEKDGSNSKGSHAAAAEKRQKPDENRQPIVPHLQPVAPGSSTYERAVTVASQLTSKDCKKSLSSWQEQAISLASLSSMLPHKKFKVTWNSRGRHGFLLILNEGVYFLENGTGGRDESSVYVSIIRGDMKFPVPTDLSKSQHRTLLLGVLVHDKEGGGLVPRFYASDILCHMGGILTAKPFAHRIKYLVDGVIMARKKDTRHDYSREQIKIRAKEYFDMQKLDFVLKNVIRGMTHETDGICFIPMDGTYEGGDKVIVWKMGGELTQQNLLDYVSSMGQ